MRIGRNGAVPELPSITITFDGEKIEAYEGETVAAAAAAAGRLALRRSEDGSPRGMFCGMGVCAECLVTVDGGPSVRACMLPVRDGMVVRGTGMPGQLFVDTPSPAAQSGPTEADEIHRPEILVVGGGPAGLSAARAAALAGADVVVLDERSHLGGQYFKQVMTKRNGGDLGDAQARRGAQLIRSVEELGVRIHRNATIWGAFGPRQIAAIVEGGSRLFEPAQLILATGAYERGVPLPGWTLPGFMTTGAVQTLLRGYRIAPGQRILVAGNGPLNLQLAAELTRAGVEVVALVEAADAPGRGAIAALAGLLRSPDLVLDGLSYRRTLRRASVPTLYRSAIVAAEGDGRVERVGVARIDADGQPVDGSRRDFGADVVGAGYGFLPANELARLLGCAHRHDRAKGTLVAELGPDFESSVPNVFIVGDGGGMVGARASAEQGFIAGCAAARKLGKTLAPALERELDFRRRRLRRHQRFQGSLWEVYRAPRLMHRLAAPSTTVCRCEHVTLQRLHDALGGGALSIGSLKRLTRAGMGRCQGRYCGAILAGLIAEATGQDISEDLAFAPRPPTRPVPVGTLARQRPD